MLEVKNLSKKFGKTVAVNNLSFNVEKGKVYSLVGPNGSGKTTTIKIITGLLKPTSGDVLINKKSILKDPERAKRYLGYIPDEPFVYGKFTGEEILYFTAQLYDIKSNNLDKTIENLLEIYNLNDISDSLFDNYSRGNKQKILILAAILHKPKLLIFDEPIVGLDVHSINTTKILLKNFVKDGGTILISTHTLPFAETITSNVGFIKEGALIQEGTIRSLKAKHNNKQLERIYLDTIKKPL